MDAPELTCKRCNSNEDLHKHHITYKPERIAFLCEYCHGRITGLNTRAACIQHKPLTNEQRLFLFHYFLYFQDIDKKRVSRGTVRQLLKLGRTLNYQCERLANGASATHDHTRHGVRPSGIPTTCLGGMSECPVQTGPKARHNGSKSRELEHEV
jgi:hypothetical protein